MRLAVCGSYGHTAGFLNRIFEMITYLIY